MKLYGVLLDSDVVDLGRQLSENEPAILAINGTAFFNQISARISMEMDRLKEIAENQNREVEVKVTG